MRKSAVIVGSYRYELRRTWGNQPPLVFCGLNPSTADAENDDMTITLLIQRAKLLELGGLIVINLFAYRATDPRVLTQVRNPVGPRNRRTMRDAIVECARRKGTLLYGWGGTYTSGVRSKYMMDMARYYGITPMCLGITSEGEPRHPLRISYSTQLQKWELR